jgi:hypothetical protein
MYITCLDMTEHCCQACSERRSINQPIILIPRVRQTVLLLLASLRSTVSFHVDGSVVRQVNGRITDETSASNRHDTEGNRGVEHVSEANRVDFADRLVCSTLHSCTNVRQCGVGSRNAKVGRDRSRNEELEFFTR